MNAARPAVGEFRGRLAGKSYDDPQLFEDAAKGFLNGYSGRQWRHLALGSQVTFRRRAEDVISGQVWAKSPRGYWVRGDDGHTYNVTRSGGSVYATRTDSLGRLIQQGATS